MSEFLAYCGVHDKDCNWNQRYDTVEDARIALERHIRESRSGGFGIHHGTTDSFVVEFVDERTARLVARHNYQGPGETAHVELLGGTDDRTPNSFFSPGGVVELRRTPPDQSNVGGLVERGTLIRTSWSGEHQVFTTVRREIYGLPTYSIYIVDTDVEMELPPADMTAQEFAREKVCGSFGNGWGIINEMVAQDGEIRAFFASNEDTVEILGMAEKYQPSLQRWSG